MTSAILALMVDAVSFVDLQVRVFILFFPLYLPPLPALIRLLGCPSTFVITDTHAFPYLSSRFI